MERRRRRLGSAIAVCGVAVVAGCSALSGLSGFHFDETTGGAGGASSAGGTSSGRGGTAITTTATSSSGGGCTHVSDCPIAADCEVASCVDHACQVNQATDDTPCMSNGGSYCLKGACVECVDDSECAPPETCGGDGTPNKCGCSAPPTCASLGKTCGFVVACGDSLDCDNGMRDGSETDVDCGGLASSCVTRCPNGRHCHVAGDCAASAGGCVDDVCCDSTCTMVCHSCTLPGKHGTCSAYPAGSQDPGRCDDTNGGCSGTACACGAGGACLLNSGQPCGTSSECASDNCAGNVCQ